MRRAALAGSALAGLALSGGGALAQAIAPPVSPVTVTPSTLAPEQRDNGFQVEIPETGALQPPPGAENLAVTLHDVQVVGGFLEVAKQTEAVVAKLRGRRVTLAEVYAAASEIEEIHARAGYVLARVSVPPQQLAEGGDLRIVVTDGFIESVDVSGLPARVRKAVRARAGGLTGRRHVTLAEIEQPLMIASDTPGLTLRSTLMRGQQPGGTRLVLEGKQQLVTGSLGTDNQLDPSLGRWDVNLQVALNSLLGLGEQIYGFASSDYRVDRFFDHAARERVLGGGVILPIGDGRFSLNPEATFARTEPTPVAGAPLTEGTLRRLTMRASETLVRTRREQAGLNLAVEQIEETNKLPGFDVLLSRDRYMAARAGASLSLLRGNGGSLGGALQFSQGLGDLGAISQASALAQGVPFSRQGSSDSFSKLTASARVGWAFGGGFSFTISARGQTSFGKALFRAEQFAPEGLDGLSAYVGGVTAVDQGMVERQELTAQLRNGTAASPISALAPYVFSAFGAGKLEDPTVLERAHISAFNLGAGLRATLFGRVSLNVEYAHGFSSDAALDKVDRVNAGATLRF